MGPQALRARKVSGFLLLGHLGGEQADVRSAGVRSDEFLVASAL